MPKAIHDPRDIPVLTEAVETVHDIPAPFDAKAVHAAVVSETLNLTDSLLHQAAKDIEAALFERVFDQLRARLPELVDRVIREQSPGNDATSKAVAVDPEAAT
jgi:Zn-dependent M32 family carboxypeptidase